MAQDNSKTKAQRTKEKAKEKTKSVARDVERKGKRQADARMDMAADGIGSVHQALDSAADRLERDGQQTVAEYARRAGERLTRAETYLREEDPDRVLADVRNVAREHPAAFLTAAAFAGVAVGRFLGSSERHDRRETDYYTGTYEEGRNYAEEAAEMA